MNDGSERVEHLPALGRVTPEVAAELRANPDLYDEDRRTVFHGTTMDALEAALAEGRLRPGSEMDDPVAGETGDHGVVSTTPAFGVAEFYARGGAPSVDEIVPVDAVEAGVETVEGDGPSATDLLDRARDGERPAETAAAIADRAAAGEIPLVQGLDPADDDVADHLERAIRSVDDDPVVVEIPVDALDEVRVGADEVDADLAAAGAATPVEDETDEFLVEPGWYFDRVGDDLPRTDVEAAEETAGDGGALSATGLEIRATGVELDAVTAFVDHDQVDDRRERDAAGVVVGSLRAKRVAGDAAVVEADETVGRMSVEVGFDRGQRSVTPAIEPAPDLLDPAETTTPPASFERAPGHVRRELHAGMTGEESVGVFGPDAEPAVPEEPVVGGDDVEVFDPDEYDGETVDGGVPDSPAAVESPDEAGSAGTGDPTRIVGDAVTAPEPDRTGGTERGPSW